MNKRKSAKMKGFMCHSPASTAVCMTPNAASVIVPRRSADKYSRLIDPPYSNTLDTKKPVAVPPVIKRDDCIRFQETVGADNVFQVVVMRVALHCQGCAGKVKKHLSKMEGVTSFSIDLESKRVTVMGHVSPIGVLESISKVKRAEFWSH